MLISSAISHINDESSASLPKCHDILLVLVLELELLLLLLLPLPLSRRTHLKAILGLKELFI
jgi:hypothetical protein